MMQERHGSRENFLVKFNPDLQIKLCQSSSECYFGDYPTLSQIKLYGENTPTAWLIPQLYDLSEYCGCRDKLEGRPIEQCASVIATEFFYLKVSEMMLFFHRFKSGRYGTFYGSVDPLVITTALRKFIEERAVAYDKKEREDAIQKIEESRKESITWEQYCKNHGIEGRTNPLDFLKGD